MPVDVERGAAAVLAACRQLTQLLRSARTPSAGAIGSWTVAETAAHVTEIIDVETAMVEGRGAPAPDLDIAAFNAAHLQTYLDSAAAAGRQAGEVLASGVEQAANSPIASDADNAMTASAAGFMSSRRP